MIVAQDGSGDYTFLQHAIDSIPTDYVCPVEIHIKNGVYTEKIHIEMPFITLIGESSDQTIITYDDYAFKLFPNGISLGTFNSYTLFVGAANFTAKNITFQNHSGPGSKVGQAIAVYVDADRVYFKNCRFIGSQDTLFTGPLPPTPLISGSFRGPLENAVRLNGRQYYENCFIQGDIDFIFGSATAYFYQCDIFSNDLGEEINGYITAASTPLGQKYGYIFNACKLVSACAKQTVYLGRPWRSYAHVAFINCEVGDHIIKEGWHDWDKPEAHHLTKFVEFNNFGPAANCGMRVSWSKQLVANEAKYYSREEVLLGNDCWDPWL